VNLLFDLDGTLTNPRQGIVACIKHALLTLNQPIPHESCLERFIGPPLRAVFTELLSVERNDARIESAVGAYRERYGVAGMFENEVYDDIPNTLASLSSHGARLFVVTSKPRVYAERIVEHFALAERFEAIYGSELSGALSDKGELIAHVLSASSLSPGDTIMVGDRAHDIVGAIRNQVLPTGVLWGYGSREELSSAGARRLFEKPRELAQLVI
jgi:phosphoglycolate phosphatase